MAKQIDIGSGLSKKQMQRKGLSRRQAVKLHAQFGEVTVEHVATEISTNGKWRDKIVPSPYAIKQQRTPVKMSAPKGGTSMNIVDRVKGE